MKRTPLRSTAIDTGTSRGDLSAGTPVSIPVGAVGIAAK